MYRNLIRILFLITLPLLFLQLYIAKKYSEPYPAIIYPSFTGTSKNTIYNRYYETEFNIQFDHGDIQTLDEKSLLGDIPHKYRNKLLSKIIAYRVPASDKDSVEYLKFKNLLKKRLTEADNSKKPALIKINKYEYRQYYREDPIRLERKLVDSTSIVFK